MSEINVKGFADLQKFLDQLPAKIEGNVMAGALRAGAVVIRDDAKQRCPVGPPSGEGRKLYKLYAGALRDTIRVSMRKWPGVINVFVKAGGITKSGADVFYAHIIEYAGSKPHVIPSQSSKLFARKRFVTIGGKSYSALAHPGMQKKPFMRPALDGKAGAAVQAIGEYIKKRLQTKEGIDTSGITIEVEE